MKELCSIFNVHISQLLRRYVVRIEPVEGRVYNDLIWERIPVRCVGVSLEDLELYRFM